MEVRRAPIHHQLLSTLALGLFPWLGPVVCFVSPADHSLVSVLSSPAQPCSVLLCSCLLYTHTPFTPFTPFGPGSSSVPSYFVLLLLYSVHALHPSPRHLLSHRARLNNGFLPTLPVFLLSSSPLLPFSSFFLFSLIILLIFSSYPLPLYIYLTSSQSVASWQGCSLPLTPPHKYSEQHGDTTSSFLQPI